MAKVAKPSVASLLLSLRSGGHDLGTATGFVVRSDGPAYLVTCRHVLRGRQQGSDAALHPSGAIPDSVAIAHNARSPDTWTWTTESLYDASGAPRWLEHPTLGAMVDVVALPLNELDGVQVRGYNPWSPGAPLRFQVGDTVSIVGFPFVTNDERYLAMWVRAGIATEPAADFNAMPCFLVDGRTTAGSAGSAAVIYVTGGNVTLDNGTSVQVEKPVGRFIGMYSGRISGESDLGVVWRVDAVRAVIEGGVRAQP